MIIFYETALQVGELINLNINDLFSDVSTPYMLVHGKGDKERIVNISSKAVEHLNNYIKIYKPTSYVVYSIINGNKNKLSESTNETFIQKYANEKKKEHLDVDISLKVHPHMFRRSRATHLYQDGVPIELVSRMLGHSSTDTTRKHYAKPSLEQMKKVIENENDIDVFT